MSETKKTTLDKYSGYFMVLPCNFRNGETPEHNKPFLWISDDCPEDVKAELLKDWEKVKAETIERHNQGIYNSHDYF